VVQGIGCWGACRMIQPAQELARCRVLLPVDAGSCGVEERRRRAAVLNQAQPVDPRVVRWPAKPADSHLDHRPSWAAQGDPPAGRDTADPQASPMPNEFIGSSEHNWLTSKVLLTAARAHPIGSVTLRTGLRALIDRVCTGQ
jgi:hypothetical protein